MERLNMRLLELLKYISEYQPQMVEEMSKDDLQSFCELKAKEANDVYQSTCQTSADYQQADEMSHETLYSGLLFSPVGFVNGVLSEMNIELDLSETLPYYYKVKSIIDKYETGDNFEGTSEEIDLSDEIKNYFKVS